MKRVLFIIIVFVFTILSCTKEEPYPHPCVNDNCVADYTVVYLGDSLNENSDGYYELQYAGLNYFQIKGKLSDLNERYIINGVPLIAAGFDSDYWVLFDTLSFTIPTYSYLGWFNDQTMSTPISIGPYTYSMIDLIDLHPPLNIVGYQIPKYFCWECPYAPSIIGVRSRYNYRPTCNVLLDNEMIGDTINIFIESTFNTDGGVVYHGSNELVPKEIIENNLKVIIK